MMQVKDVIFYTIIRFNYHRIEYEVYNAKTGSTYIKVGKDRIRIADHPGEHDDYNFVIRCDCARPAPIVGKLAVSAENADIVLNTIIEKYRQRRLRYEQTINIINKKKINTDDLKKIDSNVLWNIVKADKKTGITPSKRECIEMIKQNKGLLSEFFARK